MIGHVVGAKPRPAPSGPVAREAGPVATSLAKLFFVIEIHLDSSSIHFGHPLSTSFGLTELSVTAHGVKPPPLDT